MDSPWFDRGKLSIPFSWQLPPPGRRAIGTSSSNLPAGPLIESSLAGGAELSTVDSETDNSDDEEKEKSETWENWTTELMEDNDFEDYSLRRFLEDYLLRSFWMDYLFGEIIP